VIAFALGCNLADLRAGTLSITTVSLGIPSASISSNVISGSGGGFVGIACAPFFGPGAARSSAALR
jgi:hypothetical protein